MSIFLIDKIKPIGKFPVYEDRDGYGGFQVRLNAVDRDSIPKLNRKEGMLVYTVQEQVFWQLKGGILDSNWQQVTLGAGGGGGAGAGITIPPGTSNKAAISDGYNIFFSKIVDGYVDDNAAIKGTKIIANFGSQNMLADGYSSVRDGYFQGFICINGSHQPNAVTQPPNNGIIYFDDVTKKFRASEDGVNYKNLISNFPIPDPTVQDSVLITYWGGAAPDIVWSRIGDVHVNDSANISGLKIIPSFGSQNILTDGYYSVNSGYLGGFISFDGSLQPTNHVSRGVIYFNGSESKFKVSEGGGAWTDLIKSTVYSDKTTDGILRLDGDLDGYNSSHQEPRVGRINGASVPPISLSSLPPMSLTEGNVLQAIGPDSLGYGPINLEGGDGYVSGILPIENGGSPLTYCEFSFNSSVFRTSEPVYETVGAIIFSKSKIGPQVNGSKNRKIFLRCLMYVSGDVRGRVVLYDYSQGSTIPLKDVIVGGSTVRQHFMETSALVPQLLESEDLENVVGDSTYEVRIQMDGGLEGDQVICLMSKIYVEWA